MLAHLSVFFSATLATVSAQALIIVASRLSNPGNSVTGPRSERTRRGNLYGFAIYLLGAIMLHANVSYFGVNTWSDVPRVISCVARAIEVSGAGVFIWASTYPRCGPWAMAGSLGTSMLVGLAMMFR